MSFQLSFWIPILSIQATKAFLVARSNHILHNKMLLSTASRKSSATRWFALTRQFSLSPRTMTSEVKKLGVVGAGQMVPDDLVLELKRS